MEAKISRAMAKVMPEHAPTPPRSGKYYQSSPSDRSSDSNSDPKVINASSVVNPTTVTSARWVWAEAPDIIRSSQETLGKWLVFKRFNKLDETWHMIWKAVGSGELGATGAKSSTAMEKSGRQGSSASSRTGVICVYTSEETMDEVGFKLIHMVKQDIEYKTNEATLRGEYIATGYKKVTVKTIFWNDGDPGFTKRRTWRRRGEANRYLKG